ncbi:hypothetical protein ACHAXT_003544 [Thalassiosira profunda]
MTEAPAANRSGGGEEADPLLAPASAASTPPHSRHDAALRAAFLAGKVRDNRQLQSRAAKIAHHNALILFVWDTSSAIWIFATHLISLESIVGCALTVGATLICWYYAPINESNPNSNWWDGNLPSFLLSLAVITPLSQSISMGFTRREAALKALGRYRSAAYNLYVAHASWDWSASGKGKGRRGCVEKEDNDAHVDWLGHADETMSNLIHLADSLHQYLTLPTATRARHRATPRGRDEANEVLSTGRELFTINVYGRMTKISQSCEALKFRGMPGNEASRVRQWENNITESMEELRTIKEYRTLQALRVFERLFSLFMPPFYATSYVQVAIDTGSLALGISLGIITSVALTGLFECVRQLEDPFVSHVTLDGIDVREELVVLAYQELMVGRRMLFPEAKEFALKKDAFELDVDVSVDKSLDRKSRHHSGRAL